MVAVTRSTAAACGVFAPGHLGGLTQLVPFELVDAVLEEGGRAGRRLRLIPSRVALYLVLALALFQGVPATGVWCKLTAGLPRPAPGPSEKALRDARRRVGAAPVKALFEVLAGPVAQPRTPGTRYRGYRTVAFDGCSSTKIPDTARNRAVYGPPPVRRGCTGYPMLMLMTLVETGTRALVGAVFGPLGAGEAAWAGRLLDRLDPSMLLLNDRGFDSDAFLREIAATGARFLVRATANRRPPVLARLPDGSYLTLVAGLRLRVIEAQVTVTGADGSRATGSYRLLTNLTDHRPDPAAALVALYHERWEVEVAYLALRHTLLDGRVLRSRDPAGVEQEMWAILTLYQALRTLMCESAESAPGVDPDRMSFALALRHARDQTVLANLGDPADRTGEIGRALLQHPNPARRPRYSARKVKSNGGRYTVNRDPHRPAASTAITRVDVLIRPPAAPDTPAPAPGPWAPPAPGHGPPATPTRAQVLDLLRRQPLQPRRARDLAAALGLSGRLHTNRLAVRMNNWAQRGLITKTAPATYAIKENPAWTRTRKP
jgi:hypothetical protein